MDTKTLILHGKQFKRHYIHDKIESDVTSCLGNWKYVGEEVIIWKPFCPLHGLNHNININSIRGNIIMTNGLVSGEKANNIPHLKRENTQASLLMY